MKRSWIIWPLMLAAMALLSLALQGQDSVAVKIIYAKTKDSVTHYILKYGRVNIKTSCYCAPRSKGEMVMIAKKDIEFIKPDY
jgi:hypothetical protein